MLSERERTIKEQVKLQTQKVRKFTWTEMVAHMHDIIIGVACEKE